MRKTCSAVIYTCQFQNKSTYFDKMNCTLTHWGRVMHICVGNLIIIGSDNGLSPGRRQTITWTNVGILLIAPLRTNFSEMLIEIHTFSFKKIHLKMSSGKWRPFCHVINVLINVNVLAILVIWLQITLVIMRVWEDRCDLMTKLICYYAPSVNAPACKLQLLPSYCGSIYTCHLWCNYSIKQYR